MEWISVNKRKPKKQKEVLVYAPNCDVIGHILIGCYFPKKEGDYKACWTVYDFNESKLSELVTHWMPLPKKPR
jgi:hypothetical protein